MHSSLLKKTFSNRALKTTVAANQENKGWTGLCKPTQRFSEVVCAHLEKKKRQNKIDITVLFVTGFANTL